MKYCIHCGKELCDEAAICVHCGRVPDENDPRNANDFSMDKYCVHCGNKISAEAAVCHRCGFAVGKPKAAAEDKISVGLCILAVLVPLFGIIYWAVKRSETPKRARACGIAGLCGYALNFILSFIMAALIELLSYSVL